MLTIRRVFCPIDFSDAARHGLQYAAAVAQSLDAELTVLHVEEALPVAARAQKANVVVAVGDAASEIANHARRQSDLIVIGTGAQAGGPRSVLGSVTQEVITRASCAVMTVPPATSSYAPSDEFHPIVCATAFSRACRTALDLAMSFTQNADARLMVLHALQVNWSASDAVDKQRSLAIMRLRRGLPDDTVLRCRPGIVLTDGDPAEAILRHARYEQARLIVMGVETHATMGRLRMGSTTQGVIEATQCPVLSIRADGDADSWIGGDGHVAGWLRICDA